MSSTINSVIGSIENAESYVAPVTELERLKVEITKTLTTAGKASFELGNLLLQAREASESQADFLAWVDENFGIKKTWAFKLMRVAKTFSSDEVWSSVPASVLHTLQAQADDEQMSEARLLAESGNLNHSTLQALLAPTAPVVKPAVDKAPLDNPEIKSSVEDVPFDVGGDVVIDIKGPTSIETKDDEGLQESLLKKIEELTETQTMLIKQNEELQRKLFEKEAPRLRTNELPMLRQFNSKCHAARLGLSLEEANDKAIILDAFKSLCKAGYGRGHEAFTLIDEARHELIHAL